MALNCIVDDTALLTGTKDDTKFNIRDWVDQGALNVFVPLHTLEKLNTIRESSAAISRDALKALEWLDSATERYGLKAAGRVQLQGPEDQYMTWQEVEQYSLPDTPFSANRELTTVDDLSHGLTASLHLDGNPESGSTSASQPSSASPSPEQKNKSRRGKSGSSQRIPERVRPLINFVVWRTRHRDDSLDSSGHYILMTDDHATQKQAQKFGVRAKMMSQVAGIVAREASKRNNQSAPAPSVDSHQDELLDDDFEVGPDHIPPKEGDEYDDEILFKGNRQKRPSSFEAKAAQTLMDPDSFGRNTTGPRGMETAYNTRGQVEAPRGSGNHGRGHSEARRGGGRGQRGHHSRGNNAHSGRGNSGNKTGGSVTNEPRNRSQSSPQARQSPNKIPTGPAANQRGGFSPRGRAAQPAGRQTRTVNIAKPIDPDSYARPHVARGRGRGAQHRLWEPTET